LKTGALALMEAVSPDLEKQGFLAVVFVNREFSGQQEIAPDSSTLLIVAVIEFNIIKYEKHFYDFGFIAFVCGLQTGN
jgi:hypothetical protein